MKEPPERYWTRASIDYLAGRLSLPDTPDMQDWAFQVAEPSDLDLYLALFAELQGNEDLRFTLADIIIQAFESAHEYLDDDPRLADFLNDLLANFDTHAYQVWYWASFDVDLEDAWSVAPFMRSLATQTQPSS